MDQNQKLPILGLNSSRFCQAIENRLGKGAFHAGLIYEEFFRKGIITGNNPAFNNAKVLYDQILAQIDFSMPELQVLKEDDGTTKKFLLKVDQKLEVESVLIPMQSGGTLCISSQVGCKMGCGFCETGRMGLLKNLTAQEIVSQVFIVKHHLKHEIKNVVFMGMGEPFDNYDEVIQAAKVLMDPKGFGFARNNVTISTSGCVDAIRKFTLEPGIKPNLAVSVNAPNDLIRNRLMPVNHTYDMGELYQAMKEYNEVTGLEILTAYVLLKDTNDSLDAADQLAKYLKGLKVKVNLIPYNPQSRDRFQRPDDQMVNDFKQRMIEHGYHTFLRVTKGKDIMAACGQLGNLNLRKKMFNKFAQ